MPYEIWLKLGDTVVVLITILYILPKAITIICVFLSSVLLFNECGCEVFIAF